MTLEEYRIKHSMLIEKYQRIEFDLEGLYAALSYDSFYEALQEIEKDSIGGVVREIKRIEDQQRIVVFTEKEYEELDEIRERRNFWSHKCYVEPWDKTGTPRNAKELSADLQKADMVSEWLYQITRTYMYKRLDRT